MHSNYTPRNSLTGLPHNSNKSAWGDNQLPEDGRSADSWNPLYSKYTSHNGQYQALLQMFRES
jgi:hypothetical protein